MYLKRQKVGNRAYNVLCDSRWDGHRTRQVYVAYIGKEPVISQDKAKAICDEHGCSLDELRRVNGLTIEGLAPKRIDELPVDPEQALEGLKLIVQALESGDIELHEKALQTELARAMIQCMTQPHRSENANHA